MEPSNTTARSRPADPAAGRGRGGARAAAVAWLLWTGLCVCSPARAQFPEPAPTRWFTAEAQAGVDSTGSPSVTVSVALPHRNLVFFREGEQYVCRYRLRVVQHFRGKALDSQEWPGTVQVDSYDETRGQTTERRVVPLRLPPELAQWLSTRGEADPKAKPAAVLEVTVQVDGTQRVGRRELPLTSVVVQRQGIALAEPALYALRDAGAAGTLRENGLLVLPVADFPDPDTFVPREGDSYDLATGPVWLLISIFDLRSGAPPDSHRVEVSVLARGEPGQRWSKTVAVPATGTTVRALLRLPSSSLAFGGNEVRLELPEAAPRQVHVENYGLDVADDASWVANVDLIAPLADNDAELSQLRAAPANARAAAWAEFWRRRDPDPNEPGNPRLETHYRRVEYARRELKDGTRDGAQSDRGRVYILHGPPDSIESRSMLASSNAATSRLDRVGRPVQDVHAPPVRRVPSFNSRRAYSTRR